MVLAKAFTAYKRNDKTKAVSVLLEKRDKPESLLFESGAVAELAPWETETIKKDFSKVCDAYGCLGVLRLSLREDDSYLYLVLVTACRSVGKIKSSEISCISSTMFIALGSHGEVGISEVGKLLNSGSFYFSSSVKGSEAPLDLSLTYQRQCAAEEPDNRFFWNRSLHVHLQKFNLDCSVWLLNIMCGGIEVKTVYAGAKQAKAMVISRLSCERAGTRFNVRGVNDDGHVANFVETEQIIVLDDCVSSFVQTRGSVPVFWEQPGIQVGSHKVKLSRGFEASSPGFDRHISSLKELYGDMILINLLGRRGEELYLSTAYQDQLKASSHCRDTPLILFDYHQLCKGGKKDELEMLKNKVAPYLTAFGIFVRKGVTILSEQSGVVRTNCLDCLDRTNAVQSFIALEILLSQLSHLGLDDKASLVSRFVECFKTMWASNGHLVSRTYTGTGAMDGGARFGSKLRDGAVSVRRTIKNNFFDGSKQEAIDILLLGNTFVGALGDRARALLQNSFLHASPAILRELCDRHLEYTKWRTVRVGVGTFNVNGGHHFRSIAYKHQSLDDWLLDFHIRRPDGCFQANADYSVPTDIFAIGFEELVDLKAGNIISTKAGQRLEWGEKLKQVISRDHPYVLLTSEQLVGVCLFVFVRSELVPDIRDVAVDSVKTGLGGSAGNKGAVAIRFLLHSTSLCFVCSHFAAGQSNVSDRNNDYHDIVNKIEFPMGRTVIPHDYVFWCGDFNYRIDLPMDDVKEGIKQEKWELLQTEDQLTKSRKENKCFRGFNEGRLTFAPTYKFDPFSDDYDTSEKMRIPAWTDRVLWRRRRPRSKYLSSTGLPESVSFSAVDGGKLLDLSSDSEDEGDEEEHGGDIKDRTDKTGRKNLFKIREDNLNWCSGKLLYYHSAQLKTSDHRPVFALIEIEIQSLDKDKEVSVHDNVMKAMGPADPTIIINSLNSDDEINPEALLSELESIGNVVLVRVIDEDLLITFDDGRSALKALELHETEIDGVKISIRLKSESLLSNTDLTVGNLVAGSLTAKKGRPLSEILDESTEHPAILPVLEPIRIYSSENEDPEDEPLDEELYELSEEEDVGGDASYKNIAPVIPARPGPPASQTKKSKPPVPDRSAIRTSNNIPAKPVRVGRQSKSQPRYNEASHDDRLISPAAEGGNRVPADSPSNTRKALPRRPDRPASFPPEKNKVVSSVGKTVSAEQSPESVGAVGSSDGAKHHDDGRRTSKPVRPAPPATSLQKPAEKENLQISKVKEAEADTPRKRLGSLLRHKKEKTNTSVSIGSPFDVKHVAHVDVTNVQSLLHLGSSDPSACEKHDKMSNESLQKSNVLSEERLREAGADPPLSSVETPVPAKRTNSLSNRQVPTPPRRVSKDQEQMKSNRDSGNFEANKTSLDSCRVPPRLPPRPDRPDCEVAVHRSNPKLGSEKSNLGPQVDRSDSDVCDEVVDENRGHRPVMPPRVDLTVHGDHDRPVPPPRKGRK